MSTTKGKIEELEDELERLKDQIKLTAIIQQEKDRLENEYQRSHERFRTVFEESVLGKKIINDKLVIIKVNKALLQMLGYHENELIGKRIVDFAHADFVAPWKELQRELWTTDRSSFSFDACLIKKDGTLMWGHVSSIQIEDNGESLGYTILEDVSERRELERLRELVREQQHRQEIAETILNTQEEERKRIAESLHNGLGQTLYGIKMSLSHLKLANSPGENEQAIRYTENLITNCIQECRRISHDLTPVMLEAYGLNEAVKDICRQLSQSVMFDCIIKGRAERLARFLEVAVYRIIQELMMNISRHADATSATTTIEISKDAVQITVADNGKGFDPMVIRSKGIGLQSVRSKISLLSGSLDISSAEGKGTVISISIPKGVD